MKITSLARGICKRQHVYLQNTCLTKSTFKIFSSSDSARVLTFAGFFVVFVVSCWFTYFCYSHSFAAPFFFDDIPTFRGLRGVKDFDTAWAYIWSGVASSLGRPLSNVTFLINTADWNTNPSGFRIVSTSIHLINGLLLAWVAMRTARLIPAISKSSVPFALLLSSCWLILPISFSATLMPVQRMTLLSGSFVLVGMLVYIVGKGIAQTQWQKGVLVCSIGVMSGLVLGILAKENAILLVAFILVLEMTVLKGVASAVPYRILIVWRLAFLVGPLLLLSAYVLYQWPNFLRVYQTRDFSFLERLATESVILWDYLRLILLPDVKQYSPFNDDYRIYDIGSLAAIVSFTGWIAVGTFVLSVRKKPYGIYLIFALAWFLSAHILESTVLPLELYFEHRNYIAAIGPLAILIGFGFSKPKFIFIPWFVLVVSGFSLWRVTSVWASPYVAASSLVEYHPDSIRANQFLAIQYDEAGDRANSFRIINDAANKFPNSSAMQAARLQLACSFNAPIVRSAYSLFFNEAMLVNSNYAMADSFYILVERVQAERCPGLTFGMLLELLERLTENPKISANNGLMHHIHHTKSLIYLNQNMHKNSVNELLEAHKYMQNPETIIMISALLFKNGASDTALLFLDTEVEKIEKAMLKRRDNWRGKVATLREQICGHAQKGCD